VALHAADTNAFLSAWLETQQQLHTWSADFIQTRTLKALKEPIRTPGRLWFAAPNQFRCELGEPAQTLAVRRTNELIVFYPRLKRAEKYPLGGDGREPWRDALSLLDAGFPTSREELEARFRIRSLERSEHQAQLTLEPVSARARKFLTELRLVFGQPAFVLEANEMRFSDGSSLRNDFTNAVANPALPLEVFVLTLGEDVKLVEPLNR
jgi:outer membrane lipoprotein-sorting protein